MACEGVFVLKMFNGAQWWDRRKSWVPARIRQDGRFAGAMPRLEPVPETFGTGDIRRWYLRRPLISLAPDIIEAILRGDEPDGLSLEKLRWNLPVRWDEQREMYGVT